MKTIRAFASALLVLSIFTTGAAAATPIGITGHGACGGDAYAASRAPGIGVYVWFLDSTVDAVNVPVDITAKATNGVPDFSSSWAVLGQPFGLQGVGVGVVDNIGPELWVRWSASPATVFHFTASPKCGTDGRPLPPPHRRRAHRR